MAITPPVRPAGNSVNHDNDGGSDWFDSEGRFTKGKYGPSGGSFVGQYLEDVVTSASGVRYLRWMLDEVDLSVEDEKIATSWFERRS